MGARESKGPGVAPHYKGDYATVRYEPTMNRSFDSSFGASTVLASCGSQMVACVFWVSACAASRHAAELGPGRGQWLADTPENHGLSKR